MEKISGIVPRSRRNSGSAQDAKSSPAVRPGMPNFGRPVGISTLAGSNPESSRIPKASTAQRAVELHRERMESRSHAKDLAPMVQDIGDRFFLMKPDSKPIDTEKVALVVDGSGDGPLNVADSELEPNSEMLAMEESGFDYDPYDPPGSHLNVHA